MSNYNLNRCFYRGFVLFLLLLGSCNDPLTLTNKDPLTISQTVNMARPVFDATITNIRTKQMITEDASVLSAKRRDIIEISLWSKDFSRYPNNRISIVAFDTSFSVENKESYKHEINISETLTPGRYPVTIEYKRIVPVSENAQYIGLDNSERTFYISIE